MENLNLTDEQRSYLCDSEYYFHAVVSLKSGVNPIDVIQDLCNHIENLNILLDET